MTAQATAPHIGECEFSLFGSGVGECIVIHLGNGDWVIVDSCFGGSGERAVALEYLEKLGVDIGRRVKLIVVTHWHDDHIRGLAQIIRSAEDAKFACSAALQCKEFFTLVAADQNIPFVAHSSGTSEFADVLELLNRRHSSRTTAGPDHWASEGQRLYMDSKSGSEVWALSPSAYTMTVSKKVLGRYIPIEGTERRRIHQPEPNELSVAILVIMNGTGLLLGADLEIGRNPQCGWHAILSSSTIPKNQSHLYKVAHHGSSGADLPGIWETMLIEQPYALVTPFARLHAPLPTPDDIDRMHLYTSRVYCTTRSATMSPPRRDPAVDKTMREMSISRKAVRKYPGHIRARFPLNGVFPDGFSLCLFDGAVSV